MTLSFVTKQVWAGTSRSEGLMHPARERSISRYNIPGRTNERHVIKGTTGTPSQQIAQAEAFVIANRPPVHEQNPEHVQQLAVGRLMYSGRVVVNLVYGRDRITVPNDINPFQFMNQRWFGEERVNLPFTVSLDDAVAGTPSPPMPLSFPLGEVRQFDSGTAVSLQPTLASLSQLTCRTFLDQNPEDQITPLINTHNSDVVSMNGVTFGPSELIFLGADARPIARPGDTVLWDVTYQFRRRVGGFGDYYLTRLPSTEFDADGRISGQGFITIVGRYLIGSASAAYTGMFPIEDTGDGLVLGP